MKPAPFEYHAPVGVDEAVGLLADLGDEAKVLAGGQSLVPMLNLRLTRFEALVDLGRIPALAGVEAVDGGVRVGAMTPQSDVERDPLVSARVPLLARATPLIGHFQIRNRGTVGGSIAHADPAAEYPAVALALDAEIEAQGPSGTRTIPAVDFFAGTWTTVLEPEEILTAVRLPTWGPGSGFAVEEMARRHGDFAIAGVVCGVQVRGGLVARAAVALLGMGFTPMRASTAEAALLGQAAEEVDVDEVGRLAVEGLEPPDDLHASAGLRRRAAAALTARALTHAIEEATSG
ncbi:MAG TPA: xanthine dehydrogenase family protein subunit M [Acidimicrobiales bacterium]|nr:xanthine dehydrogenase family protein subunit M [Acidimicrobiales bacterium]